MNLIVTHTNADFDALGSAVAAGKLYPDSKIMLPGSQEHAVRRFLSLAKDLVRVENEKTCDLSQFSRLIVVDTRHSNRIGAAKNILSRNIDIHIYDHHPRSEGDIKGSLDIQETVGASITILLKRIREKRDIKLSPLEATIMLLGIYEETGSLTYRSTTLDDVNAVSYLLGCGANLQAVSSYLNRQLSFHELAFLVDLINKTQGTVINGISIAFTEGRYDEASGDVGTVIHKLDEVENFPVLFVFLKSRKHIRIIARSREKTVDVNQVLRRLGGGGHATAATARVEGSDADLIKEEILRILHAEIKVKIFAKDVMSSPVKTVSCGTTINEAEEFFKREGVKGAPCMNGGKLAGILTITDIEKAVRNNLGHSKVTGYIKPRTITIKENTPLYEIQKILFENKIGRLPVVKNGKVTGIVTRTDVMRRIHSDIFYPDKNEGVRKEINEMVNLASRCEKVLPPPIMSLARFLGKNAEDMGYMSFMVGGFVRDVILGHRTFDIDIVLEGDAIKFARCIAEKLNGSIVVHKKFGTATVYIDWPRKVVRPILAGPKLKIDIATARREKYEKPAALPTVEFASIKDDLSRRDFSINAMAISLNSNTFGQLIDFFNGYRDLGLKKIRVLHEKSFIDDPTRIFRAVRFEQRLNFKIDDYTENLIRSAIREKMFKKTENQRIRDELILILQEKNPLAALNRMRQLQELQFIHKGIKLDKNSEELFRKAYEHYLWYKKEYRTRRPIDLYVIYLMILTEYLDLRGADAFCGKFVFKRGDRMRILSYKKFKKPVSRFLLAKKEPLPSAIYNVLEPLSYEVIICILAGLKSDKARTRVQRFFRKYNGVKIKTTGDDLIRLGIKAGPVYGKIMRLILTEKLDGRIRNKSQESAFIQKIVKTGKYHK